jgi:hypothetical protein
MSTVYPAFDGFVGYGGKDVHLHTGEAYDSQHPLVQAHPQFFTQPEADPDPQPEQAPEPTGADLDALRAQAEATGIKVDRRWGAARLAQELAAVSGAPLSEGEASSG